MAILDLKSAPGASFRRSEVVRVARGWLGTPYHHQASVRGVGTDCLGLLRGVWGELYGAAPELPPAYSRDWAEATGREELLAAAMRHLVGVEVAEMKPGDVLVFRMRKNAPAKHVGVLASSGTFIHAAEGVSTSEVALNGWWRRRIAAAFAFPGVND